MNSRLRLLALLGIAASVALGGCAGATLYPARPPSTPGLPIADPPPSRLVIHAAISSGELRRLLEAQVPPLGEGTFQLLGGAHRYSWKRLPLDLSFGDGRIVLRARLLGAVVLLGQAIEFPIELEVRAEPVVSSDYHARLQGLDVQVRSDDPRLKIAQGLAGALDTVRDTTAARLREFSYDLRPALAEAYARVAQPIALEPLAGDEIRGCADLHVSSLEAAPTVLADGVEKDLAVVVSPSVTLPCAPPSPPPPLPPLENVASLPSGPFSVTVPIAARYEELARAMTRAFTDGKLYFSKEFPALYLSQPELYAGADQLVLKLHLAGPVSAAGIHTTLDGDLYLAGHPQVVDNELRIPDLQPTIETRDFLLRLKAAVDGDSIRDQARAALRLDLGERFAAVRQKLSSQLSFPSPSGADAPPGCLRSEVSRVEVTGVFAHATYLRVYLAATAQAGVYLPCPTR